jgi:hypothetical protein
VVIDGRNATHDQLTTNRHPGCGAAARGGRPRRVDGDRIIGKFARCKIKARKAGSQTINLIAACATDIMLSSVLLSAKVLDADTIVRLFPGMEDLEIRYSRCPSP